MPASRARSTRSPTTARLAFSSRTPGRTQQINLFVLRGGALVADLPGYGYAAVTKSVKRDWQDFLWQYVTTRNNLVALVLMVDARHGVSDSTCRADAIVPSGRPVLLLATKADKLGKAAQREAQAAHRRHGRARSRHGNVMVQLLLRHDAAGGERSGSCNRAWHGQANARKHAIAQRDSSRRTCAAKKRPRGQGE